MLLRVGETPALCTGFQSSCMFDEVGVLQRFAARVFPKRPYQRPEE